MNTYSITYLDQALWVNEISRVFISAYTVEAELLGVRSFPPLARDKSNILSSRNYFMGAVSEVGLVGVIELEERAPTISETVIASLAVAPSHFRQGVGKALIRMAMEEKGGGFQVTTAAMNHPAIDLYTTQGFDITRRFSTPDGFDMVELTFKPS